jgi:hypothetical protein
MKTESATKRFELRASEYTFAQACSPLRGFFQCYKALKISATPRLVSQQNIKKATCPSFAWGGR